jgi:hypothetical protein
MEDVVTTEQVKDMNRNPIGRGGFSDNPQNRNDGGRYPRGESFTYWYGYFKSMTVDEFRKWKNVVSDDVKTVVADLAYTRLENARNSLREFQEVADRSEGKPNQTIKHASDDITALKVEIVS